ncbi:MAG: alpha-amylase family glycosyl hydrolase [Candidatus Acidiferrales bacterium]
MARRPSTSPPFTIRNRPHLYEINTWAWLEQLSAKLGRRITLADVPDSEWDALAKLGFNIIWLMGVWERSPESRRIMFEDPANRAGHDAALPGWKPADVIASPYAVANYIPDAQIGNWAALDSTRERLHARGMALFLDFVGNHTALDHPWVRQHPEFYVQGNQQQFEQNPSAFYRVDTASGPIFLALGKDPYFPPWKDVAQLNHFQPAMRAAQLQDFRTIASHCDGLRCDMAMLLLSDIFASIWTPFLGGMARPEKEFWSEARAAEPNLVLLAEAYWGTEARLLELGFSFSYDKALYDAVRDANPWGIHSCLAEALDYQNHLARFLENHDENRCAATFPAARLTAAGTLMGTLPGMRFYHQGELEGRKSRLPITLRIAADEPLDPASDTFFRKILQITKDDVFHSGQWSLLSIVPEGDDSSGNLAVYEWRTEKAWKIIAVNVAGTASQGRVRLAGRVSPSNEYIFHDELYDVRYPRSGEELHNIGLFVRREAFDAHIFDITLA